MANNASTWAAMEHEQMSLGRYQAAYDAAMAHLVSEDANSRIWGRDGSLWTKDEHAAQEIEDRLGWLDLPGSMPLEITRLVALKREAEAHEYTRVVLLGMGGSSLAPEVLAKAIGPAPDGLRIEILDSTVPAQVAAVAKAAPAPGTLYVVASKSGTTAETLALYACFRRHAIDGVGPEEWADHFIAITDPGTPLQDLAERQRFRACYLNPPDIGGRFSALSFYGLVPGALLGIDLDELLRRSHAMAVRCRASVDPRLHPGLQLGALLGALARHEQSPRDKLTLVTSPTLASFGAWAEQLIAESTGKAGVGILPIEGEPIDLLRDHYRDDRLCVYLRLDDDDNEATDALADMLVDQGQPVVGLRLRDPYDLGAEFVRWEFATAAAGVLLRINPFDQPNVEAAKAQARRSLQAYQERGSLPEPPVAVEEQPLSIYGIDDAAGSVQGCLRQLLAQRTQRSYVAIMAYIERTAESDAALQTLRRRITAALGLPVTLGYGPRYLHSTGQLHKGGPATGLFLQITADDPDDLPIPNQGYTMGILKRAQALGDLNALREAQRHVLGVRIGADTIGGLAALGNALTAALAEA